MPSSRPSPQIFPNRTREFSGKSKSAVGASHFVCSNVPDTVSPGCGSQFTMASDLVVALGRATVDGRSLFGQNGNRTNGTGVTLQRVAGREFALGEKVHLPGVELPQARQTYTVLGCQAPGSWGYSGGINEHALAVGCTDLRTKLRGLQAGLAGDSLVRLALERCRSAQQAVDLLTDLVECHGQGGGADHDSAFLIVDAAEAFLLETAGNFWVCQEIHAVRAASNVSTVRQDWDRICRGLAGRAIEQGWWAGDGSKLDFAGAVGADALMQPSALRRWGRATLLLEEQNGHIDAAFLRRLLSDHDDGSRFEVDPPAAAIGPATLCQHGKTADGWTTASSLVADLSSEPCESPVAWCAFGPPCSTVYIPVMMDGELPEALARPGALALRVQQLDERLQRAPQRWAIARDMFARLQARFDQETDEFLVEANKLRQSAALEDLHRQTSLFMEHHVEKLEEVLAAVEAGIKKEPAMLAGGSAGSMDY